MIQLYISSWYVQGLELLHSGHSGNIEKTKEAIRKHQPGFTMVVGTDIFISIIIQSRKQ